MPPGEIKNYLIGNISGLSILFSTVRAFFKRYAGWLTGATAVRRPDPATGFELLTCGVPALPVSRVPDPGRPAGR